MTYEKADFRTATVDELPKCNWCREPAEYDGKTIFGPWAYMCEEHFREFGIGLGTGVGQKLKREIRPDCEHVWKNKSYDLDGKVVICTKCGETRNVELDSELGGRLWFV